MGRPRKTGGTIYPRTDSAFWWISYRDREGRIVQESTGTADRQEAERFLTQRLSARDEGVLPTILASKSLTFEEWAAWYLENRSKPPFRTERTHLQNLNAVGMLKPTFGSIRLLDITAEAVEQYLRRRLSEGRRCHTKLGLEHRGTLKPATVHQEFRVLRRILNVAVNQRRLTQNPCSFVEFPASVTKTTRKPHYMTASEQERIEMYAPNHLRNAIIIISEIGLRPYKELMPMLKCQVDLENRLVHIPDSKTPSGVGDMPLTEPAFQAFADQVKQTPGSERARNSTPSDRTSQSSKQLGKQRCGEPACLTFPSTTYATPSPADSAPAGFQTTSSRKCSGKVTLTFSSDTAKPSST